jgi:hypothetical protein
LLGGLVDAFVAPAGDGPRLGPGARGT